MNVKLYSCAVIFCKLMPQQFWGVTFLSQLLLQPISQFNSEWIMKIGLHLQKLSKNEPKYAHTPCKWCVERPFIAISLEVTTHVSDVGHRIPSIYQVRHLWAFPFQRYDWFLVTALIGLVTLNFDLSTSKWGSMGHQYHELPSCQSSASYALPFLT